MAPCGDISLAGIGHLSIGATFAAYVESMSGRSAMANRNAADNESRPGIVFDRRSRSTCSKTGVPKTIFHPVVNFMNVTWPP